MSSPSGSLLLQDFSGGWNFRDSPNELAYNETPNADNWTLDERGGLRLRKGCTDTAVALPGDTGTEAFIFYSNALNLWFCARSSGGVMHLYSRPGDLSGVWTDRGTINSDVATNVAFADFPGNPPSVVITTDSRTGATKGTWQFTVAGNLVAQAGNQANTSGQFVEVWQNRAWIGGYTASDANGNPTRLFYSTLGDVSAATGWVAANFNDIRDLNGDILTGAAVQGGSLLVFKERSAYRVNDSATGAYQTIDTQAGCAGGRAVCKAQGRVYTWGADGFYEWVGGAGRMASDKIQNILPFTGTTTTNVCAAYFNQKVYFSAPRFDQGGGGVFNNEQVYEYDPQHKWIMRHRVNTVIPALARITSFARKGNQLYAAVKNQNTLYTMFDATPLKDSTQSWDQAQYYTRWLQPNSGMLSRLHRLRIVGFADAALVKMNCKLQRDWDNTSYLTFDITAGIKVASGTNQNRTVDLQSLGHGVSFQIFFDFIGNSAAANVAIRGLQLIDQSLAWPSPGYPHAAGMSGYHRTPGSTAGPRSRSGGGIGGGA